MLEAHAAAHEMKNEIRGMEVRRHRATASTDRAEGPPPSAQGEECARTSGSTASAAPRAASSDRSCDTDSATPAATWRRTAALGAAGTPSRPPSAVSRAHRTARRSDLGAASLVPQRRCAGRTPGSAP